MSQDFFWWFILHSILSPFKHLNHIKSLDVLKNSDFLLPVILFGWETKRLEQVIRPAIICVVIFFNYCIPFPAAHLLLFPTHSNVYMSFELSCKGSRLWFPLLCIHWYRHFCVLSRNQQVSMLFSWDYSLHSQCFYGFCLLFFCNLCK